MGNASISGLTRRQDVGVGEILPLALDDDQQCFHAKPGVACGLSGSLCGVPDGGTAGGAFFFAQRIAHGRAEQVDRCRVNG